MSTLTYSHDAIAAPAAEAAAQTPRKTIWRRVCDAMIASQQRRAEREIASYLSSHGGLFTDDMEREIMRRVSGNAQALCLTFDARQGPAGFRPAPRRSSQA